MNPCLKVYSVLYKTAIVLGMVIVLAFFGIEINHVYAAEDVWNGSTVATSFAGGSGTASDPYQIATCSQLKYLAALLERDSGNNWAQYGGRQYKLTSDLNMNGHPFSGIPYFKGTFDGNGHKISGLNIEEDYGAGLFQYCTMATIKNLTVSGNVRGGQSVGGIVGSGSDCKINNCINYCTIENNGNVATAIRYGGIIGYARYQNGSTLISGCRNKGKVLGKAYAGGIVGEIEDVHTSKVSVASVVVEYCSNEGEITGSSYVGGIVGGEIGGTVQLCANAGEVLATGSYVGGIAGNVESKSYSSHALAKVVNCYNTASVSGKDYVSGVAGMAAGNNGDYVAYTTLTSLYNIGKVTRTTGTYSAEVSYYIDAYVKATFLYYLEGVNTGLRAKDAQKSLGSDEMKTASAFSGFSFYSNYWGWDSSGIYPYPVISRLGALSPYVCAHQNTYSTKEDVVSSTCKAQGSYKLVRCCVDCGEVVSSTTEYTPKLSHSLSSAVRENETPATCIEPATYESVVYCSVCSAEINRVKMENGSPLGHSEVIDPATLPTCTETGITQGSHCGVCDEIIVLGEEIPATGHSYESVEFLWDEDCFGAKAIGTCHCLDTLEKECLICETDSALGKTIITASVTFGERQWSDVKEKYYAAIEISGTPESVPGNSGEVFLVTISSDKDASGLYCFIKYPGFMALDAVTPRDFASACIEEEFSEEGYKTAVILAQYSDTELIPRNTVLTPFEMSFSVGKEAEVSVAEIDIGKESCLVGNDIYLFDERICTTLEILPKLAEGVEIKGEDEISAPTVYTAVVSPDYTTNKEVEWSVDNEEIATVDRDGLVTPFKSGKVTITATALDGSGVFGEKTVSIKMKLKADSITSDKGQWNREFEPDITEYIIYVPAKTESISLTTSVADATVKVNDASALNRVPKKVDLEAKENVFKVVLTPILGNDLDSNVYTITVVVGSYTKTEVSNDEKSFTVCPVNIEIGKKIILALYDGEKLVQMQSKIFDGENLTFSTEKTYNTAKVMVWESLGSLKPVCETEIAK